MRIHVYRRRRHDEIVTMPCAEYIYNVSRYRQCRRRFLPSDIFKYVVYAFQWRFLMNKEDFEENDETEREEKSLHAICN